MNKGTFCETVKELLGEKTLVPTLELTKIKHGFSEVTDVQIGIAREFLGPDEGCGDNYRAIRQEIS